MEVMIKAAMFLIHSISLARCFIFAHFFFIILVLRSQSSYFYAETSIPYAIQKRINEYGLKPSIKGTECTTSTRNVLLSCTKSARLASLCEGLILNVGPQKLVVQRWTGVGNRCGDGLSGRAGLRVRYPPF